jgi:hypothetical protein
MDITRDKILCALGIIIITYVLWNLYSNGNDISEFTFKLIFSNDDDIKNNDINNTQISSINYETINEDPIVNIIRDNGRVTGENTIYYEPEYIRKDTMGENDIGTTEFRFAQFPENKPSKAWVDYNISQFPGFYTSEIKDEQFPLMNFFDSENIYRETPRNTQFYNSKRIPCPSCYIDVNGTNVCNFNSKLQRIPKTLSNVESYGQTSIEEVVSSDIEVTENKQYKTFHYNNDRPMNGGKFYDNVTGANGFNGGPKEYIYDNVIKCL